jgi:hypothetical protein
MRWSMALRSPRPGFRVNGRYAIAHPSNRPDAGQSHRYVDPGVPKGVTRKNPTSGFRNTSPCRRGSTRCDAAGLRVESTSQPAGPYGSPRPPGAAPSRVPAGLALQVQCDNRENYRIRQRDNTPISLTSKRASRLTLLIYSW